MHGPVDLHSVCMEGEPADVDTVEEGDLATPGDGSPLTSGNPSPYALRPCHPSAYVFSIIHDNFSICLSTASCDVNLGSIMELSGNLASSEVQRFSRSLYIWC